MPLQGTEETSPEMYAFLFVHPYYPLPPPNNELVPKDLKFELQEWPYIRVCAGQYCLPCVCDVRLIIHTALSSWNLCRGFTHKLWPQNWGNSLTVSLVVSLSREVPFGGYFSSLLVYEDLYPFSRMMSSWIMTVQQRVESTFIDDIMTVSIIDGDTDCCLWKSLRGVVKPPISQSVFFSTEQKKWFLCTSSQGALCLLLGIFQFIRVFKFPFPDRLCQPWWL